MNMLLSNLFRKESNGDVIEFYMQRNRFRLFENSVELGEKYEKLKEQIEVFRKAFHVHLILAYSIIVNTSLCKDVF